jgi:hypothetical protein
MKTVLQQPTSNKNFDWTAIKIFFAVVALLTLTLI